MKEQIFNFLKKEYPDFDFDVSYPPEGFGDYSTNIAFLLAKKTNRNPNEAAKEVINKLENEFKKEFKEIKTEKGGFTNFYLSKEYIWKSLAETLKFRNLGKSKTVIIEYSQPNIAKIMHVGHLRSTFVGDALANIYESLGYKTVRWNYLGDWGTQFGNLIAAYKLWGDKKEVGENPIETLNNLYVRFHDEMKTDPKLEERGREEFKKLEVGDKENRRLWEWFKEESLKGFEKTYQILGIKFDTMISESFFEKDLKSLISELLEKNIAQASEGAIVVPLDQYGLPPALIQKSDGASLYLTRDIAALKYRIKEFKPEKIIYVVGNEQSLHFEQLTAVSEILGLGKKFIHVKFGLILGEDKKKLSSREGKTVPMAELIGKAVELAGKIVEGKNPEISGKDKEEIAKTVGIGALKYFILKEHRSSDIVFDWNKVLDFKGDSGPYLQYTYARLAGIKRKTSKLRKSDFKELDKDIELSLMKKLLRFPEAVISAGERNLPNVLTLYLYELCNLANRFYESAPVLSEEDEKVKSARLGLVGLTASVLEKGLALLGIKALERI